VRKLIYRLYERSLSRVIEPKSLPKHVGVILDGNRRWAERKISTTTKDGHAAGAAALPRRATTGGLLVAVGLACVASLACLGQARAVAAAATAAATEPPPPATPTRPLESASLVA